MDNVSVYQDNLTGYYYRADGETIRHARQWYGIARQEAGEIASEHGFSLKRVVFALAALSNQIDWEQNVDLALHVAFCVRNGMQPRGHYRKLLDKAAAILRDGDFDQLRGLKVIPFAACIMQGSAGSSHAVVDRWMFRASGIDERTAKARYETCIRDVSIALRRLARKVRKPVSYVQARIWLTIRREWGN